MSRLKHSPFDVTWKLGESDATAHTSSSLLDHGSRLQGLSPTAVVQVYFKLSWSHKSSREAGGKRWEATDNLQGDLPQNRGGTEQNCTVTCMVLKANSNDRRKNLALSCDEFRGTSSDVTFDKVAFAIKTFFHRSIIIL
ncbi:hypothetical protein TNCV_3519011 [Trichonephila clavipes]|uniref:Uncharacterized protein n=1 Tax=Trichonephila clavipes TaxID=2585209 RepID=A0A8X6SQ45_TRICX|nr:hypothetical protein TNCV_3519011 [Trichonephila clavipes]